MERIPRPCLASSQVVAEFKAALEARKTAEDAKLARAIEAEQRKHERQLARLREDFARAGAQATPPSARPGAQGTPASARARPSSVGQRGVESGARKDDRVSMEGTETEGMDRGESDGEREEGVEGISPTGGTGLTLRLEPEPTEPTEPLVSSSDAESDGEVSRRTVRRSDGTSDGATEPLPETELLALPEELEWDENTESLAVWQERCRQLEETVAALQKNASTAEMHRYGKRGESEGHEAECDVLEDGNTEELPGLPSHEDAPEEVGEGGGDTFAAGGEDHVLTTSAGRSGKVMTSAERRDSEERTREEGGEEDGGDLEALRAAMGAREAQHLEDMRRVSCIRAHVLLRIRMVSFGQPTSFCFSLCCLVPFLGFQTAKKDSTRTIKLGIYASFRPLLNLVLKQTWILTRLLRFERSALPCNISYRGH